MSRAMVFQFRTNKLEVKRTISATPSSFRIFQNNTEHINLFLVD